jgi:hypothetical protein
MASLLIPAHHQSLCDITGFLGLYNLVHQELFQAPVTRRRMATKPPTPDKSKIRDGGIGT